MTQPEKTLRYFSGLDLASAKDFSALAILEQRQEPDPQRPTKAVNHCQVRYLHRYPLGTPYTEIVADVVRIFGREPMSGSTLAIDQTGVGRPVVDMFRAAKPQAKLSPINITGGHAAHKNDDGGHNVPKKSLVSTLQVLLQAGRIEVAAALPDRPVLVKELQNFRVKITAAANETFEAWREGDHDDLVLAVAIAAWEAERGHVDYADFVRSVRGTEDGERGWVPLPSAPVPHFLQGPSAQRIHRGRRGW